MSISEENGVDTDCSSLELALSITHTIISAICITTAIFALYKFIVTLKSQKGTTRTMVEITTFIVVSILMILTIQLSFVTCYRLSAPISLYTLTIVAGILYQAQMYLLLMIFYNKIVNVFSRTSYQLSRNTKIIYKILFVTTALLGIIYVLLVAVRATMDDSTALIVMLIIENTFLICFTSLLISLVTLFVYKLIEVYKTLLKTDNPDEDLVLPITKVVLLTSMSLLVTAIHLGNMPNYNNNNRFIHHFLGLIDYYTNFLCVVLSYNLSRSIYLKVCSWPHNCCQVCCKRLISKTKEEITGGERTEALQSTVVNV